MLGCEHCRGHYLGSMKDVSDPEVLYATAMELAREGASGFLLSGGSDLEGSVPLEAHIGVLRKIRRETPLTINLHTGLVTPDRVELIKSIPPHVVSLDMVGSTETIREIYGLDLDVEWFENSYRFLKEACIKTVPHITVGLHRGVIKGEFRAVDMVSDTDLLVLNSLIPSHTGKRVCEDDLISVLEYALDTIPGRVYLGCMRERGRSSLEIRALKAGASGIVIPGRKTLAWARENGAFESVQTCCAVHR